MLVSKLELKKLLLCNVHIGTKHVDIIVKKYVWRRRKDGVFIFNILKTLEKINIASKAIVAVNSPEEIFAISCNEMAEKGVLKFSFYSGCKNSVGRWTPGRMTNQLCKNFLEPRLVLISNPKTDRQPLIEASYSNIPSIAFCNGETSPEYVDIIIPGNTTNKFSIAVLWWHLTREVLRLKGTLSYNDEWKIKIDSFLA
mmetsp:Transcript_45865/g.71864  ORF Transcript_45865/g.71864 Transcript_45865/m.71864 type:complete len:198 (+) Transcript_45865:43-636(+)